MKIQGLLKHLPAPQKKSAQFYSINRTDRVLCCNRESVYCTKSYAVRKSVDKEVKRWQSKNGKP